MFRRKLMALEYMNPETFNINDEKSFRDLIVWLEDQKIRHYKIEDRGDLKAIDSNEWPTTYKRYLGGLNCPTNPNDRQAVVDWLLGLAVRFEYGDNEIGRTLVRKLKGMAFTDNIDRTKVMKGHCPKCLSLRLDKFKTETAENVRNRQQSAPKIVNTNPLDGLDFQSPEFRDGVNRLAKQLNITPHPNHLITLKAISKLIRTRLSTEALQNPGEFVHQGKPYPIFESDLGFDTGDNVLNNAGKALRLMYIHDLRDLQTKINECIVSVQNITADPKTDTKLGKVGR